MPIRTRTSSDPLLAAVRAHRDSEAREQVAVLTAVLDWAAAHPASESDVLELLDPTEEPALHLAGPGAPMVGEYAALDLAHSLGMTTDAGLAYLGKALELRHRLPRLYARVARLEVPVWKAFRVADQTKALPMDGALFVDAKIAPFLHTCSFAQVDRTVDAARAAFDPDEAERLRIEAAEHRHATVWLHAARTTGTVEVTATLDAADALDLEQALRDGAQTLADLGSADMLDVRRSQALGELARGQASLDLGRGVTIYAHLDATDVAMLDNTQTPVLVEQVRQWCQTAATKVTIKPVIDLAANPSTDAYRPSEAIREHVVLRDRTCVPDCQRRKVDPDHIVPFDVGGPTSADNLAMLCRRHHRAKTHSAWRYDSPQPGIYHWISPSGATTTVDRRRRT
ncbi:MAG: endonuclease [Nocardioides sp.]|nr:endonuclease [Nocardioides sp.]